MKQMLKELVEKQEYVVKGLQIASITNDNIRLIYLPHAENVLKGLRYCEEHCID